MGDGQEYKPTNCVSPIRHEVGEPLLVDPGLAKGPGREDVVVRDPCFGDPPAEEQRQPRVLADLSWQANGNNTGEDSHAADEQTVDAEESINLPTRRDRLAHAVFGCGGVHLVDLVCC